ncbi:galactosyltransferase-related protein, partial [Vibrio vulnificus]|uniref:galactosyltransferase-related protein n=1 Tax=Vibrio vulnificus TaxID=672 RepID=UPI0039B5C547
GQIEYTLQSKLHQDWLDQRFILTEKYSSGTSVILINRVQYHRLGGHSEDFEQWGYEDLEFNCRAIEDHGKFLRPANPQSMQYNFNSVNAY